MLKTMLNPLLVLRRRSKGQPEIMAPASQPPAAAGAQQAPRHDKLNPYVEARREWNERYGDYIQQAHHWRVTALISGLVALVAVIALGYVGAQGKIVPYVVEVSKLGQVAAISRADRASAVDARVIKAYLARFIEDWRDVVADRQAQKDAIDRVYAMVPSQSLALRKMNEHFAEHNPFALAANQSVNVSLTDLLPISDRTWQVEWQEVTRDKRGEIKSVRKMKASVIVGITPPTDEKLILMNPLGVYVTDLNWSQEL